MRKLVAVLFIVFMVSVFFTASLSEIKERGVLIVGTEPTFPPFEFVDQNNSIVGFDIDIAKKIANELGVELKILNLPFDSLIPAIMSDKIDLIIAGMTITNERAKVIDFSIPYFNANQSIVVRKGENFSPKSLEDLKGKKVAVQLGTTGDLVVSKIKGIKVTRFQKFTDAFLELQNKRVDAVVLDEAVANAYVKKFQKFLISSVIDTGEKYGIGVKKGNKELLDFVNSVISNMFKSPYDILVEKWF
ncbi:MULTISPECIES: basic amino acid ABC transporter substrate-binding protein [unclassified Thermosipho (in: thermotogales)]|uniref:basic amino acid ABC transporter substrate-binding protein n=1 Tax=unclassified Thermosipho (in: thermotogales) TaxID=2676525 RepID=UPI0009877B17|nr:MULTISPECIES: basic amino acid ABC transporter substrate-binding protein [unclassified Thermosipho (in: thermotogales)]MBT1247180.1 amino acid ABC transporter substrate-binding protein [Thermosipho sp. 1244]OOC47067.1 amino acid ABC transporter substrate-binding protein [Thermosipho sp. 1223]